MIDAKYNICIVQNEVHENAGKILNWLEERKLSHLVITPSAFENGDNIPEFEMLIILGGAVNVDERDFHPWLLLEISFIQKCCAAQIPVLGICLGSQLLAYALGAKVFKLSKEEIGWHGIQFDLQRMIEAELPENMQLPETVMEWHSYNFEIPSEALRLASTTMCQNQAFIAEKRFVGLQFHPEWTREIVEQVHKKEGLDASNETIQSIECILSGDFGKSDAFLWSLLDHLYSLKMEMKS